MEQLNYPRAPGRSARGQNRRSSCFPLARSGGTGVVNKAQDSDFGRIVPEIFRSQPRSVRATVSKLELEWCYTAATAHLIN